MRRMNLTEDRFHDDAHSIASYIYEFECEPAAYSAGGDWGEAVQRAISQPMLRNAPAYLYNTTYVMEPRIAPLIELTETLGATTLFSCAGHAMADSCKAGYFVFSDKDGKLEGILEKAHAQKLIASIEYRIPPAIPPSMKSSDPGDPLDETTECAIRFHARDTRDELDQDHVNLYDFIKSHHTQI